VGLLPALFLCAGAAAQDAPRTHDIVPEDYFTIATIMDLAPSPDGKYVAYVELRWDPPADRRVADLWVVSTESGKRRRLTFDPAYDLSPRWAPDSGTIYFLSRRKRAGETEPPYDGKAQVWAASPDGGEPRAVTRVHGGIDGFDLARSGRALYLKRTKKHVAEPFKALRTRFAKLEYGHGVDTFHTLWKLDLETWRDEKLVDENRFIRYFKVSPDETRIAMITDPRQNLITHEGWSRVDVYDAATRKVTSLEDGLWRAEAPSPFGWLAGFAWSADSRAVAFDISFDGYPSELFVAEWADNAVHLLKIERPDEVHIVSEQYAWQATTRNLCFLAAHRGGVRVHQITNVSGKGQGEARVLSPEHAVVSHFGFVANGNVMIAAWSDPKNPGDIYAVSRPDVFRRLTRLNPQMDAWKLPVIKKIRWKGANGDEVEGILELPPDHAAGQPLPTIVELHGGPTSATQFAFRFWIYGRALMAAKGYALISPNYRGSTGYGDKFMTDLIGRENDIEVEDILKGVDHLVKEGIADPERLGVMGWSNGGFLTNALITKSTRFKAASSGAGVLDMTLQWAVEDTPGHVVNFTGGKLPWDDPEPYRKASPVYFMKNVTTPTLVHVGGNDARVPAGNSRGLYRALRHYLKVPTELVIYPGAGHGLTTYQHRLAKMKWDLAWFDRYLPPRPTQ